MDPYSPSSLSGLWVHSALFHRSVPLRQSVLWVLWVRDPLGVLWVLWVLLRLDLRWPQSVPSDLWLRWGPLFPVRPLVLDFPSVLFSLRAPSVPLRQSVRWVLYCPSIPWDPWVRSDLCSSPFPRDRLDPSVPSSLTDLCCRCSSPFPMPRLRPQDLWDPSVPWVLCCRCSPCLLYTLPFPRDLWVLLIPWVL